jgi:hypothetical protein
MSARFFVAPIASLLVGCGTLGLDYASLDDMQAQLDIVPGGQITFESTSSEAKSAIEEVLFASIGELPVNLIDIYLDDTSSQAFNLPDDLPLPLRLEPGDDYPVEMTFSPYGVGQYSGNLTVVLDVDGEPLVTTRRVVGSGCSDEDGDGTCG